MADDSWFDPAFYNPLLPFMPMMVDVAVAYERAGSLSGEPRRRIISEWRSKSWADYRASLEAVNGTGPVIEWNFFQNLWARGMVVWINTSPEMRRHAMDTTPRHSWATVTRNGSEPYRHRFVYHILIVMSVVSSGVMTQPDIFRAATGYDTVPHRSQQGKRRVVDNTIEGAVTRIASESKNWQTRGSEFVPWCGWVTSIWDGGR